MTAPDHPEPCFIYWTVMEQFVKLSASELVYISVKFFCKKEPQKLRFLNPYFISCAARFCVTAAQRWAAIFSKVG